LKVSTSALRRRRKRKRRRRRRRLLTQVPINPKKSKSQ
jgi:hypothetical protein